MSLCRNQKLHGLRPKDDEAKPVRPARLDLQAGHVEPERPASHPLSLDTFSLSVTRSTLVARNRPHLARNLATKSRSTMHKYDYLPTAKFMQSTVFLYFLPTQALT